MSKITPAELGVDFPFLNTGFVSAQPDLSDLEAAYASPSQSALLDAKNPLWAKLVLQDGVTLLKTVSGRSGVQTGIPQELIPSFRKIMSAPVDYSQYVDYASGTIQTGIDVAFSVAGALPIVGAIAKAAVELVFWVVTRSLEREGLPPQRLSQYSKGANDAAANAVLNYVGVGSESNPDWTPIFRPPSQGSWVRRKTTFTHSSGEYAFQPSQYEVSGLGYVPGYMRGLSLINFSAFQAGIMSVSGGGSGDWNYRIYGFQQMVKAGEFKRAWQAIKDGSYDVSETTPSGVQAAAAAWQMLNTRTAAMFNCDVRGLAEEWEVYVLNALAVLDDYEQSEAKSRSVEQAELDRFFSLSAREMFYDRTPTSFSNWDHPKNRRIDTLIKHKLNSLKTRQIEATKTVLIAYCSENQRAFRNPNGGRSGLGDMLVERRKQLLTSKWVQTLRLEDIIDLDYREAVAAAQRRGDGFHLDLDTEPTPLDAASVAFLPINHIPVGDAWGPKSDSGWGLGKTALLGALVYGGYRLFKAYRSK